jgi:glycosyltransferase involved in cell wall biosynthesis
MQHIHLINSFEAYGGSELRTLALFDLLKDQARVSLWATRKIHSAIASLHYNIQTITENHCPENGVFIFVGCYQPLLAWLKQAKAQRTILVFNSADFNLIPRTLLSLSLLGARIEMVYAAKWMRDACAFPGEVHPSLIDLKLFSPKSKPVNADDRFVVGRHSRDALTKFHSSDTSLFQQLAKNGCLVKIMGGTVLSTQREKADHVEIYAERHEPAHLFLQSLDCFYYRTSDELMEASGRVVTEAMACGLPVVVHRRGGYVENITHGVDGLIFETPQQAYDMINYLKNNREVGKAMGQKARAKMEKMFGPQALGQMAEYYLASTAPILKDDELIGLW